jgi:hypothetical protein
MFRGQMLELIDCLLFFHHPDASRNSSGDLCRTSRLRGAGRSTASC